jgi:hypothetical protein
LPVGFSDDLQSRGFKSIMRVIRSIASDRATLMDGGAIDQGLIQRGTADANAPAPGQERKQ